MQSPGVADRLHPAPHFALDDVPWVAPPAPGAAGRSVHVRIDVGLHVTRSRFDRASTAPRDRSTGPVLAVATTGSCGYGENAWLNRAGSYRCEPLGSLRTLPTPPEACSAVYGEVPCLDAGGEVVEVSDATRALQRASESGEAAGPRPSAILR